MRIFHPNLDSLSSISVPLLLNALKRKRTTVVSLSLTLPCANSRNSAEVITGRLNLSCQCYFEAQKHVCSSLRRPQRLLPSHESAEWSSVTDCQCVWRGLGSVLVTWCLGAFVPWCIGTSVCLGLPRVGLGCHHLRVCEWLFALLLLRLMRGFL